MKGALLLVLVLGVGIRPAVAQGRLVHGDFSGTLGWFGANHDQLSPYDEWHNRNLLAEVGVGWYWTDHWKSEISIGASSEATIYGATSIIENGQSLFAPSRISLSTRRLSVTQQYQFGDNQWFHGYLGAGIDGVWERSSRRDEPVYFYDSITRQGRLVRGALDHPQEIDGRVLAALSAGFKAYLTRRGFFRSDLRATFAGSPEEVIVRFGFGVDF